MRFLSACVGVTICLSGAAFAQGTAADRLPEIPPDKLTNAQREAARSFQEDRGVPVFGPFVPLLRSPQLMLQAMSMGDYLRYHNTLPPKINEFVILITAREWTQQLEWQIHQPIAVKAGLAQAITDQLARVNAPRAWMMPKRSPGNSRPSSIATKKSTTRSGPAPSPNSASRG